MWFRRDLRIHDHPALSDAVANARRVRPLFVLDERLLGGRWPSANRVSFMLETVAELGRALDARSAPLAIVRGDPETAVAAFAARVGAEAVLVSRDVSVYGRRRDQVVAAALGRDGRTFHARRGNLLHEPEEVRTREGGAFSVFSPFWRAATAVPLRAVNPVPSAIGGRDDRIEREDVPAELPRVEPLSEDRIEAGESAAR